jgi:hypothetical protein
LLLGKHLKKEGIGYVIINNNSNNDDDDNSCGGGDGEIV